MTTKAVFFDLGGTLLVMRRDRIFGMVLAGEGRSVPLETIHSAYVRAEPWWLSAHAQRKMTPDETAEAYRELDAHVYHGLFPEEPMEEVLRFASLARKRWPELEKEVPLELYPDAEPVLARLSSDGLELALVSNAPPDTAKVVEALGLPRYLGHIVISGLVGYSKPNPEIFRIALREAGVAASETIHIGDLYESDVVGSREAGIKGILIDREGMHPADDCPKIKTLDGIFDFID